MAREHAPSSFKLNVQLRPDSIQAAFLRRAMSVLEQSLEARRQRREGRSRRLDRCRIAGSVAEPIGRRWLGGHRPRPLAPMLARSEASAELLQLAGGALPAEEAGRMLGHASGGPPATACQYLARRPRGQRLALSSLSVPSGRDSSQECADVVRAQQVPGHGPCSTFCSLSTWCSRATRRCRSFGRRSRPGAPVRPLQPG